MENGVATVEEACQLHEHAVACGSMATGQAAMCAQHALVAFEREYGLHHPDVANILNNLAGICADQGDYTEAARLAQRAVAIMEQATGSPDLELLPCPIAPHPGGRLPRPGRLWRGRVTLPARPGPRRSHIKPGSPRNSRLPQ